ncbi:hypothetical protein BpHYR1_046198 [Brachionus plicatilis]|uniref:Uncharacterized protein n=1 Tax=Brachionus plicatilis TaxID=10195 RepID=A0A3M7Q3F2_BRAPC|nr:hypothetical protein BpHYR1_046198 [Brachionus plicatilis]
MVYSLSPVLLLYFWAIIWLDYFNASQTSSNTELRLNLSNRFLSKFFYFHSHFNVGTFGFPEEKFLSMPDSTNNIFYIFDLILNKKLTGNTLKEILFIFGKIINFNKIRFKRIGYHNY